MNDEELFLYDLRDDHIAVMTLNRPDKMNALSDGLASAIHAGIKRFETDQDAWVGVLTGNGKAFCAGGDLEGMRVSSMDEGDWVAAVTHLMPMFDALEQHKKPIIGAINGFAMGGGLAVANACSLVVAAESARFGMPEAAVSVTNFSYFDLWTTVGYRNALELSITAEPYSAEHMQRIGFVSQVVSDDQLMDAAIKFARRVTKNGPMATAGAELAMRFTLHNPKEAWPEMAPKLWSDLLNSEDLREGLAAFGEKRKPQWKNA